MEESTFADPGVIEFTKDFAFAKINAKEDTLTAQKYGIVGFPTVVLLNPQGEEIDRIWGFLPPGEFTQRIENYMAGKETFTSYQAELEQNPGDLDLLNKVAEGYCSRGKFEEAIDHYEKIVQWDQGNEKGQSDQAVYQIGLTYLRAKEYAKAIPQFDRLVETYPNSALVPDAWVYKGYVYQRWEKNDEAIAVYQDFLDTFPDHEEVEWVTKQITKLKGE